MGEQTGADAYMSPAAALKLSALGAEGDGERISDLLAAGGDERIVLDLSLIHI